jgi:hypothetical protein
LVYHAIGSFAAASHVEKFFTVAEMIDFICFRRKDRMHPRCFRRGTISIDISSGIILFEDYAPMKFRQAASRNDSNGADIKSGSPNGL